MTYKILNYPDKPKTPSEVQLESERSQKVRMGFEQLKQPGVGPGLKLLCDEHGYVPPQWLLWQGRKYAICELCVRYYCKTGGSKLAVIENRESPISGPDGGP